MAFIDRDRMGESSDGDFAQLALFDTIENLSQSASQFLHVLSERNKLRNELLALKAKLDDE